MRWYVINLLTFTLLQSQSLAQNFLLDVFLKHKDLNETSSKNEASFKEQLSEHSVAIQKLELEQKTCGKNDQVLQQLSNNIQQLQTKLSKIEQTLDRNALGIRLLLTSSPLNLGEMLLTAVKVGDVKQVLLLLELGASIEFQDSKKNRPIHVAVENNHPRVLEVLLENRADIESHGEYQKTALHLTGYTGCFECGKLLVDKRANLESLDQWRNTPIIHPSRAGFNEFVELLLQKGANVNAAQMQGWTGLHFAAQDGPLSTVKILVENGADVRLKNENGETPLDIAVNKKRYLIADYLQKV